MRVATSVFLFAVVLLSNYISDCLTSQKLTFSFIELNGEQRPLEVTNFPYSIEEDASNFCKRYNVMNSDCVKSLTYQTMKVSQMHDNYSESSLEETHAPLALPSLDELQLMQQLNSILKPRDGLYKLYNIDHAESYSPEKMSGLQFHLLYLAGIDERSKVLEIGCGAMSLAKLLIPYLSRSHYTCLEPLKWLVETSLRFELGVDVLHIKNPTFLYRNNFTTLNILGSKSLPKDNSGGDNINNSNNNNNDDGDKERSDGQKFDYILAHSVFSHTNERLLEFAFENLFEQMQEDTLLIASFVIRGKSGVSGEDKKSEKDGNGWIFPHFVEFEDQDIVNLANRIGLSFGRIDLMHPFQNWYIFGKNSVIVKYISRKINDRGLNINSWEAVNNQGRFRTLIEFEGSKSEYGLKNEIDIELTSDNDAVLLKAVQVCTLMKDYYKVDVARDWCMMHYSHEISLQLVKQGFIPSKREASSSPILSSPDIFSANTMWRNLELKRIAKAIIASYHKVEPYPHAYFDATKLFGLNNLRGAVSEFVDAKSNIDAAPDWGWSMSKLMNSDTQYKKASLALEPLMGPYCQSILAYMKSSIFIKFLEQVTNIPHLIADPLFHGSGLHQTYPGGFLSIHTDFNKLENYNLWRRVNIFLYLNEDWDPNWKGGSLELWNETHMVKEFAPLFGRLVIFTVSKRSFHGHPWPLQAPSSRKSLALYYYSSTAPQFEENDEFRSTVFPKHYPNPNKYDPENIKE